MKASAAAREIINKIYPIVYRKLPRAPAISKEKVNERQVYILWTLESFAERGEILKIGQLGRLIDLSPSISTRQIKSLEKRKLVKKSISPIDERNKTVQLTQEGIKVLHREKDEREKWFEKILSILSEEERRAFVTIWQKIVRVID